MDNRLSHAYMQIQSEFQLLHQSELSRTAQGQGRFSRYLKFLFQFLVSASLIGLDKESQATSQRQSSATKHGFCTFLWSDKNFVTQGGFSLYLSSNLLSHSLIVCTLTGWTCEKCAPAGDAVPCSFQVRQRSFSLLFNIYSVSSIESLYYF